MTPPPTSCEDLREAMQEKCAEAEEDCGEAIERGQDDALVYVLRGGVRSKQEKWAGAEEDFGRAVERGGDYTHARRCRASARVHLGQLDAAREDCDRAQQIEPDDPSTHTCWGHLHLARREYDAAITRYETALKPEANPERYFELSLAYLLVGRLDEAREGYGIGFRGASITDIKKTQRELDFWTAQQHDRVESPEAKEAIADIHQKLQLACKKDRLDG